VVEQIEHDHHGCRRPAQARRLRLALAKVGTAGNAPVEVDGERALAAHIENPRWLLTLVRP
jgi:hypothetical protein